MFSSILEAEHAPEQALGDQLLDEPHLGTDQQALADADQREGDQREAEVGYERGRGHRDTRERDAEQPPPAEPVDVGTGACVGPRAADHPQAVERHQHAVARPARVHRAGCEQRRQNVEHRAREHDQRANTEYHRQARQIPYGARTREGVRQQRGVLLVPVLAVRLESPRGGVGWDLSQPPPAAAPRRRS
jgi:hypothetical protein